MRRFEGEKELTEIRERSRGKSARGLRETLRERAGKESQSHETRATAGEVRSNQGRAGRVVTVEVEARVRLVDSFVPHRNIASAPHATMP